MLAAIRILFLLGFRRVYLLGVDFDMSPERRYHFEENRSPGAISGNNSTYAKLGRWFAELQPYFLHEGFVIKNCNPKSKLTAFPYLSYVNAVEEALAPTGNYHKERTAGMYDILERKEGVDIPASSTELFDDFHSSFPPSP